MIKAFATHRHMLSAGYFACFLALLATSVTAFSGVGVRPLHNHGLGMASIRGRAVSQQSKFTVGARPLAPANGVTGLKALVSAEGRAAGRDILSRLKLNEVEQLFSKLDVDGNGQMDPKSLRAALKAKGVSMTDYEFMKFLQEMDKNLDGKVCVTDFENTIRELKTELGEQTGTQTLLRKTKLSWLGQIIEDTDTWRESTRRYKRTVFEPKDWVKYRSSTRLLDNLLSTFDSGVIRALWFDILVVSGICTALLGYNHGVEDKLFLEAVQGLFANSEGMDQALVESVTSFVKSLPVARLPLQLFSLTSPALGLLLVFRTNQAFQRFFEARALWGALINYSRNSVRQALMYCENPKDVEEITRRTITFARSLKLHLRYDADKDEIAYKEFRDLIGKDEAERLLSATHRPCQALSDLTTVVRRNCKDDPLARLSFDRTLEQFSNQLGACERIFKTPLPLLYTRHTARFLTLWCLLLPFGLYSEVKGSLILIPVCAGIAAFKLGIEELGVQITEPFSVLPLESMCDGIENSLSEMARRNTVSFGLPPSPGDDARKIINQNAVGAFLAGPGKAATVAAALAATVKKPAVAYAAEAKPLSLEHPAAKAEMPAVQSPPESKPVMVAAAKAALAAEMASAKTEALSLSENAASISAQEAEQVAKLAKADSSIGVAPDATVTLSAANPTEKMSSTADKFKGSFSLD